MSDYSLNYDHMGNLGDVAFGETWFVWDRHKKAADWAVGILYKMRDATISMAEKNEDHQNELEKLKVALKIAQEKNEDLRIFLNQVVSSMYKIGATVNDYTLLRLGDAIQTEEPCESSADSASTDGSVCPAV